MLLPRVTTKLITKYMKKKTDAGQEVSLKMLMTTVIKNLPLNRQMGCMLEKKSGAGGLERWFKCPHYFSTGKTNSSYQHPGWTAHNHL